MASAPWPQATLADLYETPEKAELIGGRIVYQMPSGDLPGDLALEIAISLRDHARATGLGKAHGDNVGYAIPRLPSGRESFAPDASYYVGALPANRMRFIQGPPTFAVEVRSENDYGPAAERELAAKRADYFAAGTQVVWDVDPRDELVRSYRRDDSDHPTNYHRGDVADAEPAVPGWRIAVDALFA
jgi:Uma2 family endonuclease